MAAIGKWFVSLLLDKVLRAGYRWLTSYIEIRRKRKTQKKENQKKIDKYKGAESEEDRSDSFDSIP